MRATSCPLLSLIKMEKRPRRAAYPHCKPGIQAPLIFKFETLPARPRSTPSVIFRISRPM